LVEDYFDEFERVYDDRFADKHGFSIKSLSTPYTGNSPS
jgi:hypothetical protein